VKRSAGLPDRCDSHKVGPCQLRTGSTSRSGWPSAVS
jgi:hypothetical protein